MAQDPSLYLFYLFYLNILFYLVSVKKKKGPAYKSSLRDSISKWVPRGKNATSDVIRPWKPSL